ncbi:MAG: peptidylprolyl isomerase [Chloroflexi bacterium]|nr:peptidylprolyl isomerase [Chloroflexota bacterium]
MTRSLILIFIALFTLAACGGGDDDGSNDSSSGNAATSVPATSDDNTTITTDDTPEIVAIVNGQEITYTELQQEVTLTQETYQPADLDAFELEVLENLINQSLIEQYAQENNITVSEEEVQAEIALLQELATESDMTLSQIMGFPADQIDTQIRELLLSQAVQEHVLANERPLVRQVHARHILVKDEELARDLIEQLNSGADFAELAEQFSEDESTARVGGDLGWIYPGLLIWQNVEEVIFQMPVNSRWPDPVPSVIGYHIIESIEEADRQLEDTQTTDQSRETFNRWLSNLRNNAEIERFVS